jgi:hypothetical protein
MRKTTVRRALIFGTSAMAVTLGSDMFTSASTSDWPSGLIGIGLRVAVHGLVFGLTSLGAALGLDAVPDGAISRVRIAVLGVLFMSVTCAGIMLEPDVLILFPLVAAWLVGGPWILILIVHDSSRS